MEFDFADLTTDNDDVDELEKALNNITIESVEFLKSKLASCLKVDGGKEDIKLISRILPAISEHDSHFFHAFLQQFVNLKPEPEYAMHLFCAFSNRIFQECDVITTNSTFWSLIQQGLISQCSLTRKRALYLAKRFTDEKDNSSISKSSVSSLFNCSTKLWDEYFIILESLEEKQVHIVEQILPRLNILADFHPSWATVAFNRFFAHQNIIVVRWGLEKVFDYMDGLEEGELEDCVLNMIVGDLLQTLNITKLYTRENETHTGHIIQDRLCKCINNLLVRNSIMESRIVNSFVDGICKVSWGPLPLFWISCALANLTCSQVLQESSVTCILDLVEHHIVYQEPVLRGAAQQNLLLFILSKSETLPQTFLEKILYTFWERKVIFVDTLVWSSLNLNLDENMINQVIKRLAELNKGSLNPYNLVEKSVISCLLPVIAVISKDDALFQEYFPKIWQAVSVQKSEDNRLYSSSRMNKNVEESVRLKYLTLKAVKDILTVPLQRKGKQFLKYQESSEKNSSKSYAILKTTVSAKTFDVQEFLSVIVFLMSSNSLQAIDISNLYINLFDLVPIQQIKQDLIQEAAKCMSNTSSSHIAKSISIKVLLSFAKEDTSVFQEKLLKPYLLTVAPASISLPSSENREEQKLVGKLLWEFNKNQLEFLTLAIIANVTHLQDNFDKLQEYAFQSLDLGGTECVLAAADMMIALNVSSLEFVHKVRKILDEFRKNESFWPVMESLIRLLISQLKDKPDKCSGILVEFAREANVTPGLMALIAHVLHTTLTVQPDRLSEILNTSGMIDILVRMITFGPTVRKDQKIITETNKLISEHGAQYAVNLIEGSDHLICDTVRKIGLDLLLKLIEENPGGAGEICSTMLKCYTHLQVEVSKGRARHFENSEIHKCKNRMLQCLLIVGGYIAKSNNVAIAYKNQLIKYCLDQLLEHNDQTSVRHLLEWTSSVLIAETCRSSQSDEPANLLWTWLETASQVRPGSVPSFITIIINIASSRPDSLQAHKTFLDRAVSEISPWSMAQQYGLRIVSQLGFKKLWPVLSHCYPDLVAKYQVLHDCISKSLQLSSVAAGGADKTAAKLMDDFYQSVFNPYEHFTLEDIFIHFPRLCCLPQDEISSMETLDKVTSPYLISLRRKNKSTLEECTPSKLVSKDPLVQEQNPDNIQRKITPWKSMNIETEQEDSSQRLSKSKGREYEGLIVVASLIDRLPNLGGLCRTCEILGVGKMTIPSALAVKEREFTGVSVTAEQWLPMEEVPESQLLDYIQNLKSAGWSIVAVEQASKSVPLHSFEFPEKCAIILGKEREGVPVEILNHVDYCVEIPQHGLIRSFNVHVTGSIVLWEYVRQRIQ